jgi:hypothetical protein
MEGHDYHQFFNDELAVQKLFKPYFRYVATRTVGYTIGQQRDFWRCSDSRKSLMRDAWNWAGVPAEPAAAEG